jgi:hypothetical protein
MAAADERVEINLGDSILVLEGNVIELFHKPSMINRRWHVCHAVGPAARSRLLRRGDAPTGRLDRVGVRLLTNGHHSARA